MFDAIPVRFWLLLLIAIFAWPSAHYVFQHWCSSAARRDITQPTGDLSWRTTHGLSRSLLILGALAGAAIFIFTSYAERIAGEALFFPILMAIFALWALSSVANGLATGRISPFVQGASEEYDRQSHPKRFWASLVWNTVLGGIMLFGAFVVAVGENMDGVEDRCFSDDPYAAPEPRRVACTEAVAIYDSAIGDDPSDYESYNDRALAHGLLGNDRAAIADYSTAIRLRPNDAAAYLDRGLIHLDAMDYDLALADFDRAQRLNPRSAAPLANRGIAYAWKGFTDDARRDFERARAIDPTNLVVMRGEVLLAMNLADFNLAVKRANEALSLYPDDPWTLTFRADAYRRLGEHQKADADVSRVRTLVRRAISS